MALALAAAMTVSMTSAVFAADEIKSADDLEGKKIGVQLGTTGDADRYRYQRCNSREIQ